MCVCARSWYADVIAHSRAAREKERREEKNARESACVRVRVRERKE